VPAHPCSTPYLDKHEEGGLSVTKAHLRPSKSNSRRTCRDHLDVGEDRVVPPNQTELMVAALKARGVPVGYFLFDGEQHGFRRAENIRRALDAELYFYAMLILRSGLRF